MNAYQYTESRKKDMAEEEFQLKFWGGELYTKSISNDDKLKIQALEEFYARISDDDGGETYLREVVRQYMKNPEVADQIE